MFVGLWPLDGGLLPQYPFEDECLTAAAIIPASVVRALCGYWPHSLSRAQKVDIGLNVDDIGEVRIRKCYETQANSALNCIWEWKQVKHMDGSIGGPGKIGTCLGICTRACARV